MLHDTSVYVHGKTATSLDLGFNVPYMIAMQIIYEIYV